MARLTNAERATARAELAAGMSLDAVMKKYGIAKSSAYYLSAIRHPKTRVQVPEDIIQSISDGNMSVTEAAKIFCVSPSSIYQRIRKAKLAPGQKYARVKDARRKVDLWTGRGYSVAKIMERTGLSRAHVQRLRREIKKPAKKTKERR